MANGSGNPARTAIAVPYAPNIINSPCAILITPIIPNTTASPADASTRDAAASPIWSRNPKMALALSTATNRFGAWPLCASLQTQMSPESTEFLRPSYSAFFGGSLGVYWVCGLDLVKSAPASPSQYGLISGQILGNEMEWSSFTFAR